MVLLFGIITFMAATCKPRTKPTWTQRPLLEWAAASDGPALKIDRDKRIVYGVKVLGRFSRNSHGLKEAENGTEYTRQCMESALPLYEGAEVLANHDASSRERGVEHVVGVLRDAHVDDDGIRANLHYFDSHPVSARVLEDIEHRLGVLGLSHDAEAGRERFDRVNRRLVIESLKAVKSVDIVRKPATNRNLWESQEPPVKTSLRKLIEGLKLTPTRNGWRKRLLEDDSMVPPLDAPVDQPDDGTSPDPDDALADGFRAAIMACVDDDSMDAAAKIAKIKTLLTTHEKLTQAAEPDAVQEEDSTDPSKKADDDKMESIKNENAALRHKLAVRSLADELGIKGDKTLLESAEQLPTLAAARKLLEREKARGPGVRSPGAPSGDPDPGYKPAANGSEFARRIKG